MRRRLARLAIAAVVLAVSSAASAEPRPMAAQAQVEMERGDRSYAAKDYAGAIAAYEAGFAVDPHPDFLYKKGQALRLLGKCEAAIQAYQGFLASSPPLVESERTHRNITRCQAQLLAARRAEERPQEKPLEPRPRYRDVLGGVLAGGALVGLGVGAAYFSSAASHAELARDPGNTLDDYFFEADLVDENRERGTIALAVGGALAIAAILRYALHEPPLVEVTGALTPDGAAVAIGGSF
jgi:tetratricopeptide (TPR) repeat protein